MKDLNKLYDILQEELAHHNFCQQSENIDGFRQGIFFAQQHISELQVAEENNVTGKFFIQDSRVYVGNCIMWWRAEGKGYTTDISDAGRFTKEEAEKICNPRTGRKTDIMHRCEDILPLVCGTVDMQKVKK